MRITVMGALIVVGGVVLLGIIALIFLGNANNETGQADEQLRPKS